jgi:hypothetical protein
VSLKFYLDDDSTDAALVRDLEARGFEVLKPLALQAPTMRIIFTIAPHTASFCLPITSVTLTGCTATSSRKESLIPESSSCASKRLESVKSFDASSEFPTSVLPRK